MRFMEELILSCALGFLALEFIPMYGDIMSGLFAHVSAGLGQAA